MMELRKIIQPNTVVVVNNDIYIPHYKNGEWRILNLSRNLDGYFVHMYSKEHTPLSHRHIFYENGEFILKLDIEDWHINHYRMVSSQKLFYYREGMRLRINLLDIGEQIIPIRNGDTFYIIRLLIKNEEQINNILQKVNVIKDYNNRYSIYKMTEHYETLFLGLKEVDINYLIDLGIIDKIFVINNEEREMAEEINSEEIKNIEELQNIRFHLGLKIEKQRWCIYGNKLITFKYGLKDNTIRIYLKKLINRGDIYYDHHTDDYEIVLEKEIYFNDRTNLKKFYENLLELIINLPHWLRRLFEERRIYYERKENENWKIIFEDINSQ